jgi:hypothetical protein
MKPCKLVIVATLLYGAVAPYRAYSKETNGREATALREAATAISQIDRSPNYRQPQLVIAQVNLPPPPPPPPPGGHPAHNGGPPARKQPHPSGGGDGGCCLTAQVKPRTSGSLKLNQLGFHSDQVHAPK